MKTKEAFIISLTLFLTVIAWIVVDLYHVLKTKKIPSINPQYTKPISVTINSSVFKALEEKQ